MSLVGQLIGFGLRQVIGLKAGKTPEVVVDFVVNHLSDHSQTLPKALARANDRSWQALGIALAGDGLLDQIKIFFASGDDKGIREQVRLFLDENQVEFRDSSSEFQGRCLAELKKAKQTGLLSPAPHSLKDIAKQTASFQRYSDPQGMIEGAERVVRQIADELDPQYPNLAKLLRQQPSGQPPLLVSSFAYFFRREVETNQGFAHGLLFDGLRQLSANQDMAFAEVGKALDSLGDQFDRMLVLGEETYAAVLRLPAEMQQRLDTMNLDLREQLLQIAGSQRELLGAARAQFRLLFEYIAEETAAGVAPQQLNDRLGKFEAALAKRAAGQGDAAEGILTDLSKEQPRSAVLAVALGAAQHANRKYVAASQTLIRAHRLRPLDEQIEKLSRIATGLVRDTPAGQEAPQRSRPKPGDLLDGWLLEKDLGQGGFGQVFRATKNGQARALKILHPELADNPNLESRFKREIILLAGLDPHLHLVRIDSEHPFGWAGPWRCWYYVMELVEGKSLQAYLETKGALTFDVARHYFTGVIEGLAIGHGRGVHHRDIKPANILVRALAEQGKGRFVLADFGHAGSMTPLWAAPEQLRIGNADARSDVYCLAATIHYCLTFGDPAKEYRYKAKFLPETVPLEYRALLDRCLDTDPDERPQNAGEFLEAWREIEKPRKLKTIAPVVQEPKGPKASNVITNSMEMNFKYIEPGTFWMGSLDTDHEAYDEEKPRHQVTISKPFYLGTKQVTRGQFQQFVRNTGYKTEAETDGGAYNWTGKEWTKDPKAYWRNPGFDQTEEHPVVCVSWNDAQKFLAWLKEKEDGCAYRLPTEAEWEYACRAGTTWRFFTGDGPNSLEGFANVEDVSFKKKFPDCAAVDFDDGYVYTSPVGEFKPNPWGLHDMIGNVWEWCQDWYGDKEYQRGACKDPDGPGSGSRRVYRGGSWSSVAGNCRAANRGWFDPAYRSSILGFRLALVPSGS